MSSALDKEEMLTPAREESETWEVSLRAETVAALHAIRSDLANIL